VSNETDAAGGSTGTVAEGAGDGALRLAGSDTPKALADALTAHWTDAVMALSTGDVERHARDVLHDEALAADIAESAKDKSVSEDTRLFRVIMRLDPRENPQFMGYELSEQGLAELASEVDGPFPTWSATAALRIIYTDRVLSLYADAAKTQRFREFDERWHEEFDAWSRLTARSSDAGGPDIFSKSAWRTRAKILQLLIDTKGDEELRTRARAALQKPTVASWTKDVGTIEGAGVGTLMGIADLGDAADIFDQTRRDERKATASRRRKGALSGFVSIGLIVVIVVGVAAFASSGAGNNNNLNITTAPTVTASASINPVTADVIGTGTVLKPTDILEEPKDGSKVVHKLKKDDRVYQVGHDQNGFYQVRLSTDAKVYGWVDKNDINIICPVQCG
jgi:hypothetical protein